MWYLIFSLLLVSLILFQQEFVHISYAQLIISIASNVEAGGGNKNDPLNHYRPENLEIQVKLQLSGITLREASHIHTRLPLSEEAASMFYKEYHH